MMMAMVRYFGCTLEDHGIEAFEWHGVSAALQGIPGAQEAIWLEG